MTRWVSILLISLSFSATAFAEGKVEERSGLRWTHLSTTTGDLPLPGPSTEQTGALVADLSKSGHNDFVLSFRKTAPALVWYRRTTKGWDRYLIDNSFLTVEAGGAICDIDGDGYPDIVFGADYQGDELWWWENPAGKYDANTPWKRHIIKKGGKHQHHDQVFGDFKGTGKPQLAFWNQGAKKLLIAEIPTNPREALQWEIKEVFSGKAGAPATIQSWMACTWAVCSAGPSLGMRVSSWAVMRWNSFESSGLPGTSTNRYSNPSRPPSLAVFEKPPLCSNRDPSARWSQSRLLNNPCR